jgi:hypothetical protein
MAFTAPKFNSDIRVLGKIFSSESPFQNQVLDIQTSAVDVDPGATPTKGDRYIIENSAALHANFGTITGIGNDDIVEYDGSAFIIAWDASANGAGACAYDLDSNTEYCFTGSEWGSASHPTGGDGVTFNGGSNRFDLDLANTTPGLELTASDGSGELQLSAQGNGISGGAGSLLSADPASEVAGSRAAVYVGADGIGIDLDNATLDHSTSTLQVKALGIGTAQLAADAVDSTKIADDAIGNEHLQNNAVDTAEIAANAVETAKILDANVTIAKIELLAEAELIVGNGSANSKVDTSSVGDILSDETNGLTIKAGAVDTAELAADAVDGTKIADDAVDSEHLAADAVDAAALDYVSTELRSGALTDPFTAGLTRTFTHNWATQDVQVEVYDVTTGETCYAYVTRASNSVAITLNQTPTNSLRILLREVKSETTITVA